MPPDRAIPAHSPGKYISRGQSRLPIVQEQDPQRFHKPRSNINAHHASRKAMSPSDPWDMTTAAIQT